MRDLFYPYSFPLFWKIEMCLAEIAMCVQTFGFMHHILVTSSFSKLSKIFLSLPLLLDAQLLTPCQTTCSAEPVVFLLFYFCVCGRVLPASRPFPFSLAASRRTHCCGSMHLILLCLANRATCSWSQSVGLFCLHLASSLKPPRVFSRVYFSRSAALPSPFSSPRRAHVSVPCLFA